MAADDIFTGRHSGVDADISVTRARLHAGSSEPDFRHDRGGRRHSRVAGWRMAGRLSAAAHEGLVLFRLGGQHGAGRSGHDRGACSPRDRSMVPAIAVAAILAPAEHFAAECGADQFGGAHIRATALAVNIFIFHLLRRRAFSYADGLRRRPVTRCKRHSSCRSSPWRSLLPYCFTACDLLRQYASDKPTRRRRSLWLE